MERGGEEEMERGGEKKNKMKMRRKRKRIWSGRMKKGRKE